LKHAIAIKSFPTEYEVFQQEATDKSCCKKGWGEKYESLLILVGQDQAQD
jgi:hypothetical protein